jgi:hypothetical protein
MNSGQPGPSGRRTPPTSPSPTRSGTSRTAAARTPSPPPRSASTPAATRSPARRATRRDSAAARPRPTGTTTSASRPARRCGSTSTAAPIPIPASTACPTSPSGRTATGRCTRSRSGSPARSPGPATASTTHAWPSRPTCRESRAGSAGWPASGASCSRPPTRGRRWPSTRSSARSRTESVMSRVTAAACGRSVPICAGRTTSSHVQPRSVRPDGTSGHARRRPAIKITRLKSERSLVRSQLHPRPVPQSVTANSSRLCSAQADPERPASGSTSPSIGAGWPSVLLPVTAPGGVPLGQRPAVPRADRSHRANPGLASCYASRHHHGEWLAMVRVTLTEPPIWSAIGSAG